jgi:hypothetical protein
MGDEDAVVRITLRDVYDRVGALEQKIERRIDAHEESDNRRFDALNIRVFGILATVVAASIAVVINISGVHLP